MAASILTAKVTNFIPTSVTNTMQQSLSRGPQLVTKFPAMLGTYRFITTFITPCHQLLS